MISPTKLSHRNIKRIGTPINDETKNTKTYEFYQSLITSFILILKNEKDKLNYSIWLMRLNKEENNSKILHLIKILYISMCNNRSYYIFTKPPPENLSDLNLEYDHTVQMIEYLRVTTLEENKHMSLNESISRNSISKRSAAVHPDMCSYSLSKTSHYIVQSFYATSDRPIYAWYNPAAIEVPNNIDHNQWELYLTRFNLLSQNKNKNRNRESHTCADIMKLDQVSKEVVSKFNWHPHSILFTSSRPRKSADFYDVDAHVLKQPVIQQEIDEAAFAVVHNKSFPGFKALNPRAVYDAMMPDPVYEFKMTGVRITYNGISPCMFKSCTRRWVAVPTCGRKRARDGPAACERVTTLHVTEFRRPAAAAAENENGGAGTVREVACDGTADRRSTTGGRRSREKRERANASSDCDWTRFPDEPTSAGRACENPADRSGNGSPHVHRDDDRVVSVVELAGPTCSGRSRERADAHGRGPRKPKRPDDGGPRPRKNRRPPGVRTTDSAGPGDFVDRPTRDRGGTSKCDAVGGKPPVDDGRDGAEGSRCAAGFSDCESPKRVEDESVPR